VLAVESLATLGPARVPVVITIAWRCATARKSTVEELLELSQPPRFVRLAQEADGIGFNGALDRADGARTSLRSRGAENISAVDGLAEACLVVARETHGTPWSRNVERIEAWVCDGDGRGAFRARVLKVMPEVDDDGSGDWCGAASAGVVGKDRVRQAQFTAFASFSRPGVLGMLPIPGARVAKIGSSC
jgi:hypothetical protein